MPDRIPPPGAPHTSVPDAAGIETTAIPCTHRAARTASPLGDAVAYPSDGLTRGNAGRCWPTRRTAPGLRTAGLRPEDIDIDIDIDMITTAPAGRRHRSEGTR